MRETLRTYAQLGLGFAEVALTRAATLLRDTLEHAPGVTPRAGDTATADQSLTQEELPGTGVVDSDALRREVDLAIGRLGLVREEEIAALRRHVRRLEDTIASLAQECAPPVDIPPVDIPPVDIPPVDIPPVDIPPVGDRSGPLRKAPPDEVAAGELRT